MRHDRARQPGRAEIEDRTAAARALYLRRFLWQSSRMDKGVAIRVLRSYESELKAAGVLHLRLFGSVARGDNGAVSDIDLMADFDPSLRHTLLGMTHLENRLSDLLGTKVDLSPADAMRDPVRARAAREAVDAF